MKEEKRYFIDLHCHPFKEYYDDAKKIIDTCINDNIKKCFIVGTNLLNSQESIDICKNNNFKNCFPIIGIHPNEAFNKEDLKKLNEIAKKNFIVGIGEVGIDLHYDDSPSFEEQKLFFIKQIDLANSLNIPVIVHSRDAHEETFEIIQEYLKQKPEQIFILHSYSSGPKYVLKYLELKNVYFSFSGVVTFKNAKETQEALKLVPLNKIFCETDSPYLTPEPLRGQKNYPNYVKYVYEFIAKTKQVELSIVEDEIIQNTKKVFKNIKWD